jgi:surface protein
MEKMFYGLIHLKKINFGNIDTSQVENMDSLFYNCSSLISIDLSEFNTSKVRTIKNMFYGCSSLKFLNLFKFKINKKVIIDDAFQGIPSYAKYCINDKETRKYLLGNVKSHGCSYVSFHNKRKISMNEDEICIYFTKCIYYYR